MSDTTTTTQDPPATETHNGSCHCKRISFTVRTPPLYEQEIISCNCSLCMIKGYLLIYRPGEDVVFSSGEGELTGYKFNTKTIEHCFCPTCGTAVYGESQNPDYFPGWKAINVRTLHDVDIGKLKLKIVENKDT